MSNICGYEHCKAEVKDKLLNVKGRLRKHIDFWRNVLKARENVCKIIFSVYIVPFFELPESKYWKNNKSAIAHSDFVIKSIQELLYGIVVKVDQIPHVVNSQTVFVNAKGNERLILDLRHVNQNVVKYKFKLDGIQEALDLYIIMVLCLNLNFHQDITILICTLHCINILDFHGIIVFMYFLLYLLVFHEHHLFVQRS